MGIISILLGIIAFIAFTGVGAFLGNEYVAFISKMGSSFTTLQTGLSNTQLMIIFIGVFGFIGLLVGVTLIMLGLNYNKLCKIQKRVHRL